MPLGAVQDGGEGVKLIDKDEFDRCLANAQSKCKKNGGNFRYGVLNQVRGNLAEQPTVDAIPVEWIKQQTKVAEELNDKYCMYAFRRLIDVWQNEQEMSE